MAVTEIFSGTEAISTTEWSLTTDSAGPDSEASDHAVQVVIELEDATYNDDLELKMYETCRSGGTQRLCAKWPMIGDQRTFISPIFPMLWGWDFTLDAFVGTITANWSIRSLGTPTLYVDGVETVSTTEHSLTTDTAGPDSTTDDKGIMAFLDFSTLDDGDHFRVKVYEKSRSGDTQRQVGAPFDIKDGRSDPMLLIPLQAFLHGWDITVDKIAGTDRSIEWSLRAFA